MNPLIPGNRSEDEIFASLKQTLKFSEFVKGQLYNIFPVIT